VLKCICRCESGGVRGGGANICTVKSCVNTLRLCCLNQFSLVVNANNGFKTGLTRILANCTHYTNFAFYDALFHLKYIKRCD
jgi:hypothetical protein